MFKVRNQKGQTILEYILMMAIFVAAAAFISNKFNEDGLLESLVQAPFKSVSHMISYGTWVTKPSEAVCEHPHVSKFHWSIFEDGEDDLGCSSGSSKCGGVW